MLLKDIRNLKLLLPGTNQPDACGSWKDGLARKDTGPAGGKQDVLFWVWCFYEGSKRATLVLYAGAFYV